LDGDEVTIMEGDMFIGTDTPFLCGVIIEGDEATGTFTKSLEEELVLGVC